MLFILDTGDIVDEGSDDHSFSDLANHLERVKDLPYLVAVGNHELQPKEDASIVLQAHQNTANFLGKDYKVGQNVLFKEDWESSLSLS